MASLFADLSHACLCDEEYTPLFHFNLPPDFILDPGKKIKRINTDHVKVLSYLNVFTTLLLTEPKTEEIEYIRLSLGYSTRERRHNKWHKPKFFSVTSEILEVPTAPFTSDGVMLWCQNHFKNLRELFIVDQHQFSPRQRINDIGLLMTVKYRNPWSLELREFLMGLLCEQKHCNMEHNFHRSCGMWLCQDIKNML